jgi:uncharacterized RDD family membrane protein YckC
MHLQIVSDKNKDVSLYRLILRNIFAFIWPIEILLCVVNNKRLGDIVFKTQVVFVNSKSTMKYKTGIFKIALSFLVVFVILLTMYIFITIIFRTLNFPIILI